MNKLTVEDLRALIQVVNEPRKQDLQTAGVLIGLSNKLSAMIDELVSKQPKLEKPDEPKK